MAASGPAPKKPSQRVESSLPGNNRGPRGLTLQTVHKRLEAVVMVITYRDLPTWKYQLLNEWTYELEITEHGFKQPLFHLTDDGLLTVHRGYCWDGPSGPTIDTKNFMRGSLAHDVLYQSIRLGLLPFSLRKAADLELVKLCKTDGMSWLRRKYVYRSLRLFGGRAAKAKDWSVRSAP